MIPLSSEHVHGSAGNSHSTGASPKPSGELQETKLDGPKTRRWLLDNRRLADVTCHVETSADCVNWTPIFTGSNFSWVTTPGTTLNDTFASDMTDDLEVIDAAAAPGTPRNFMRMRLVEQ